MQVILEGSRLEPGMLMGVGPGLCRMWASENSTSSRHLVLQRGITVTYFGVMLPCRRRSLPLMRGTC